MKNKELFDRTISILVKAYLNNTLDYFDCKACAVGNIVAGNMGYDLKKDNGIIKCSNANYTGDWADAIALGDGYAYRQKNRKEVINEIKSTGYSSSELALIELAFLTGTGEECQDNYGGLMSVCDCLMTIHEANEQEISEAKQLFTINN